MPLSHSSMPMLHFLRRYVLLVRGDGPFVPERIADGPAPVAPEHVPDGLLDDRAGVDRLLEHRIRVPHIQVDPGRRTAERFRRTVAHLLHLVGDEVPGVADLELRVHDAVAVRPGDPQELLGAESLLVEIDRLAGSLHGHAGRDGMVSLRYRLYRKGQLPCLFHRPFPFPFRRERLASHTDERGRFPADSGMRRDSDDAKPEICGPGTAH